MTIIYQHRILQRRPVIMKYYGLIDLGSHEISMTIYSVKEGQDYKLLEKVSRTLALGADTYAHKRISIDKIRELGEIFKDFELKLKEYPKLELIAFAESAIREAENQLYVLDYLSRETGIDVKVLSSNEQAQYQLFSYYNSIENFSDYIKKSALFLDLGAGSVQFTLFENGKLAATQNMRLGSLRVHAVLEELQARNLNYKEYLLEYISGDLAYYKNFESRLGQIEHLFISGENLNYIKALANIPEGKMAELEFSDLENILEELDGLSLSELVQQKHFPEDHARLILPTALMLREVFRFTEKDTAYLPDSSLDKGVLIGSGFSNNIDLLQRDYLEDRISLARNLASRYETDKNHCGQVEFLAIELFDGLKKHHGLKKQEKHFLQLASILHNVGKFINIVSEDKRSYEIVKVAEIPGLAPCDLEFIALIIYFHEADNRHKPEVDYRLSDKKLVALAKLSAILGLANAMDSSHQQKIKKIKIENKKEYLRFVLYSNEDIGLELWKLSKEQAFFEDVFSIPIEFVSRPVKVKDH